MSVDKNVFFSGDIEKFSLRTFLSEQQNVPPMLVEEVIRDYVHK